MDWLLNHGSTVLKYSPLISILVTIVLCFLGYRLNKTIEGYKTENAAKIEGLKAQLNAKFHAQTTRFQKEFEVYEETWKIVVDLMYSIGEFQPGGKQREKGETPAEMENRLRESLNNAKEKFAFAIHYYRPFYSPEVFLLFRQFQDCVNEEAEIYNQRYLGDVGDEAIRKVGPNRLMQVMKDFEQKSEIICKAIEKRVKQYEFIEDEGRGN